MHNTETDTAISLCAREGKGETTTTQGKSSLFSIETSPAPRQGALAFNLGGDPCYTTLL